MKQAKRVLSVLLCLVLLLGVLPVSALAEDAGTSVGVKTLSELQTALNNAADANSGNTTINLTADITLKEDDTWTPVYVDGYNGAGVVTLNANGHTITGLDAPLFKGGFGGKSGIVIKGLTLKGANITVAESYKNAQNKSVYNGAGAFIQYVEAVDPIWLENCHLVDSEINGGHWAGGLIGYTAGYNGNDGPRKTNVTLKNCSVENSAITSPGSVGGLIGHAGGNPATYTTITNCTVEKCKLTSSNVGDWRVGDVVGTANSGQVTVDQATVDHTKGNTRTQVDATTGSAIENGLVGRAVLNNTGLLIVAGRVHVGVELNATTVAIVRTAQGKMTTYDSLDGAVTAAKSGDTVVLVKDVTLDSGIAIDKSNITINGNGKKITAGDANTDHLFDVNGNNLTNVTIKNCVFDIPENTQAWVAIYVQKTVDGLTIEGNTFDIKKSNLQCIGFAYTNDRLTKNITITGNTVNDSHTDNGSAYFVLGGVDKSGAVGGADGYSIVDLKITNNKLTSVASFYGTWLTNVKGLTVTGNTFDCAVGIGLNTSDNTSAVPTKVTEIHNNTGSTKNMVFLYDAKPLTDEPVFFSDVDASKISLFDNAAKTNFAVIGFDANGGTCKYLSAVAKKNTTITLPTPTRSGYTFHGWYDGSTKVDSDSYEATKNVTLTASWSFDPAAIGGTVGGVLLAAGSTNAPAPTLDADTHTAYVEGYPDGTVKPNGKITRAETAAILYRLMTPQSRKAYLTNDSNFHDVDFAAWYNTYVATLNAAGVITDSENGYFRPNDAITRAELAAMLAQFAKTRGGAYTFTDVTVEHWAANAIRICANLGWINGYPDGTFRPDATITRAELMAMLNRATGRTPREGTRTWRDNADKSAWYYLDVQTATND